jgi:hypothetical protein
MDNKENLSIWNQVNRPPQSALKQINAGRLKGKTDINPQWRYQAMTEQFGPCGVGWKYEIVKLWIEPAPLEQSMAFAQIGLYIKSNGEWSDPIPGVGGSMAIAKEKNGLHASDECFKMAITDALSVAMKMIGVAADIYAGLWDGAKYIGQSSNNSPSKSPRELMFNALSAEGLSKEEMGQLAIFIKGVQNSDTIPADVMKDVSDRPKAFINEWRESMQAAESEDVPY